MKHANLLKENLSKSIDLKERMLSDIRLLSSFQRAAEALAKSYQLGGKILIAGNGGSAADAQHLAAEFVSKLARERDPLPAEALTVDSSIITAIGNDYGFEKVFARQILGKAQENDIFLGITTSGNSQNIIEALRACKEIGVSSILLSAGTGGLACNVADISILVPKGSTANIQEAHLVIEHTLCELIENLLFGE